MATSAPVEVPPEYGSLFMSQYYTSNFCTIAVSVLLLYEHMLTIAEESQHFWHGRLTGSKLLFFTNRYALCAFALLNLGDQAYSIGTKACAGVSVINNLCIFILYASEIAYAALRAFAISGYSWPAALLVLTLGSISIWVNVYLIARTTYYVESYNILAACANTLNVSGESYYKCLVLASVSNILSDAVVLAITWWKTRRIKRAADIARMRTPLTTILLRDGTVYFAALAALNIAQAVVQIYAGSIDYMSICLTPLPAICIARFLSNLRSSTELAQLASLTSSTSEATQQDSLLFAHRIAGNLGSMLGENHTSSWAEDHEESESLSGRIGMIVMGEPDLTGAQQVDLVVYRP